MSDTEKALLSIYFESNSDSAMQVNAENLIESTLASDHDKDFATHIMEILHEAIYIEKRNAFKAGLKAGMEVAAFATKGEGNE